MDASLIGCIFDCDGTLIDSMNAWRNAEAEFARRTGAQLTKEERDILTTMTAPESSEFFHTRFGLCDSAEQVRQLLDSLMLEFYREHSVARPGALDFVRGLAERGVHITVASSSPQSYLQAGMEHCGFMPYIQAIVSVDDVGASKREPAVYRYARKLMATPIQTTWGFEDATYAIQTLKNAGFRTVATYDCDASGTFEDLSALAEVTIRGYDELPVDTFIALNQ